MKGFNCGRLIDVHMPSNVLENTNCCVLANGITTCSDSQILTMVIDDDIKHLASFFKFLALTKVNRDVIKPAHALARLVNVF
ncbi:hypothetical protein HYC85_020383 [Camellia sinensis]|uniref:Uncharacterized protein n=1 Tax=Camellia sinensis TaxID=4442 RepID=A0A7J7GS30_CAMSI|nr:hypothetical protein HYC85_020383 [Camellia sinensis]